MKKNWERVFKEGSLLFTIERREEGLDWVPAEESGGRVLQE